MGLDFGYESRTMLKFLLEQLWLIAIPIWAMIFYILYSLFTDEPEATQDKAEPGDRKQ
jgi:hypothetical protein